MLTQITKKGGQNERNRVYKPIWSCEAPQRVLKTPFFLEWRNLANHEKGGKLSAEAKVK
ncbi:hypothetical protein HanXRQr2_Chr13g0601081 [Helianthus annuus]|uniref:Uncharacterized protein n=1 Tax=Helianthus annuus TaxID=4232 RepID=A0A251SV37_HELAN|nr:hypothetical protein HanXRQr2_Chr13g0601081 [Helianthus annuus]KAJ0850304.1 hypothetical protein HanPSC8_Chr13g0579091 [Helianthus annuus]